MVNAAVSRPSQLTALLRSYAAVAVGTVVVLAVLANAKPELAPSAAWGHAIIVSIFAVLLLARWHRARRGDRTAIRAVRIITAVLLVVNVVEACLNEFPAWMRIEMIGIAAMMLVGLVLLTRVPSSTGPGN